MWRALRRCFDSVLRSRGYELKELGSPPRGYSACLEYAKSRGLAPRTVFDIGVGHGTPWLYDEFPDAKLVLFEPLSVFDAGLADLESRYRADVHKVALSDAPGVAEFNFNTLFPTSSSLLDMDSRFAKFAVKVQAEHQFSKQTVKLDTLDALNKYPPPYVLKLDVEGGEMRVLEGAQRTLKDTHFLLTEMSVMKRQAGEPDFSSMIEFLDKCGFELFDIPTLEQVSGNGQLIYLDAAFVPKNSALWPQ